MNLAKYVYILVLPPLLFQVGKGYGSHDSTKLISTRILQDYGDWVYFDSIIEAAAVQSNPFVLRYLHDFRLAFKYENHVYFLFSRTLGIQDTKNFTFISRMCENDLGYYSYTELQLNCSATNKYNKAQVNLNSSPSLSLHQLHQFLTSLCFLGCLCCNSRGCFSSEYDQLRSIRRGFCLGHGVVCHLHL